MNEMMRIYLNTGGKTRFERKRIIQRMDSFLLEFGVEYSGTSNLYVPMVDRERDDVFYRAKKSLAECEWLKGIVAHVLIFDRTDVCRLDEIDVQHMMAPSEARYLYYERYYMETGKLPHGILVDENRCLREGYVAYLLARKHGAKADVREAFAIQPCKKIVTGRYVSREGGEFRRCGNLRCSLTYDLREPVVPGDILAAGTDEKPRFLCVESVSYLTGKKFCGGHKGAREHLQCRMRDTDDTCRMESVVAEKGGQNAYEK